jgi:hypothetical protein
MTKRIIVAEAGGWAEALREAYRRRREPDHEGGQVIIIQAEDEPDGKHTEANGQGHAA